MRVKIIRRLSSCNMFIKIQICLYVVFSLRYANGFTISNLGRGTKEGISLTLSTSDTSRSVETVEDASALLAEWDKFYNPDSQSFDLTKDSSSIAGLVPAAVRLLSEAAANERNKDSTLGRCMLGICASSSQEGIATLKSWVTALQLPRGLLHGMDKDGVPLELEGGVYIKYNSGGVYTFADIRKSGMGFDALWKPGDALLEPYDGNYRGVYFQVELTDGEFRQYLVPLETFDG